MKDRILKVLIMIFSLLFLIYPSSYGLIDLKIVFLFVPIFFIVLKLFQKFNFKINEKYYIWIIFISALITRVGVSVLFEPYLTQVSDFKQAIELADNLKFTFDYHRVFTHWVLYPTLVHYIFVLFGAKQIVAILLNAIILSGIAVLVYIVATKIFKNKKYGFIASLLYIFWPANILYTLIFTPEHLCTLLLLIVINIFIDLEKNNDYKIKDYLKILLIGIILGISTFFKNFAPVFIIAFVIYFILKCFKININKKLIISKLLFVVILLVGFVTSKNVTFSYIDGLLGKKAVRNITACYLNVGLRNKGTFDKNNYNMYFDILKRNNYDEDKTNSEIMSNLKTYLGEKQNLISLFDNKADIVYGGDSARIMWVKRSLDSDNKLINYYIKIFDIVNKIYFVILVFFMSLGLIDLNKKIPLKLFLLYLIFFGCMLLLLFVEAQNRYMYSVQFLMCILAIPGLVYLKDRMKKFL